MGDEVVFWMREGVWKVGGRMRWFRDEQMLQRDSTCSELFLFLVTRSSQGRTEWFALVRQVRLVTQPGKGPGDGEKEGG